MRNKYAELFTAKLNDMDLVLFEKHRNWDKWELAVDSDRYFMVSDDFEYFLCLPQHKEAVLGGLCGKTVESTNEEREEWSESSVESSVELWDEDWWYMLESYTSRIKPKKEKRWIGVYKNGATTDACLLKKEAKNHPMITDASANGWQFIEIEVEV